MPLDGQTGRAALILRAGSVPGQRMSGSSPWTEERFGDAAGLDLMGVNIVTLAPGERSARRHWHSGSDAFVTVLSGTATLVEDDAEAELGPPGIVLRPAGAKVAHQVLNRADHYLCAGTNPPHEAVRYPDERETLDYTHPHWHLITDDGRLSGSGREG